MYINALTSVCIVLTLALYLIKKDLIYFCRILNVD